SEERYRSLAESTPIGVFEADLQGRCTYVNPRWEALSGLTLAENLGDGWQRSFHPDDVDALLHSTMSTLKTGSDVSHEARMLRPDGTERWVEIFVTPRYSPSGEPTGLVGAAADITEQKQAVAAARTSQAQLT